jgi:tetratricopeptide (TPR) repeat protein
MEKWSNLLEVIRKILINVFLGSAVIILIAFLVSTSNKRKLLLLPVEVPENLKKEGYSSDFFTSKILDRISLIKLTGSSYYENNDIMLAESAHELDVVNNALANTPLQEVKEIIAPILTKKQKRATGLIVYNKDKYEMTFRIEGKQPIEVRSGTIDSLVSEAAEYVMQTSDPYYLGAYYFQRGEYEKCLRLVQMLLNNDEEENKYLALHIRGNVYIKKGEQDLMDKNDQSTLDFAREVLDSALSIKKRKSPWLTYNSIGNIYRIEHQYDLAKLWYRKSIDAFPEGATAYLNYGYILLDEINSDSSKTELNVDSAVYYFKGAIARNKNYINCYLGALRAYVAAHKRKEVTEYFYKCLEMDPKNPDIYQAVYQMVGEYDPALGESYFLMYQSLQKKDSAETQN